MIIFATVFILKMMVPTLNAIYLLDVRVLTILTQEIAKE